MHRRLGHLSLTVTLGALLAACNHPTTPALTSSNPSIGSSALAQPAATASDSTWGNYLAGQGKLYGKDVSMRPYIYVIPAGANPAAKARRQSEVDSVVHSIGSIVLPGGMLIVGGSDPKQTTAFLGDVAKQVKADSLKGIVVMVVSDASEQAAVTGTLKASGATVRFVTM
ncbi:hypothetical protein [Caballeronia ptereochthonis]|uniref:Lipoprotein n=1 Tax=Caballeronia ptereochthonis TaxID=1777144 RepID=A0A157Z2S6_9BURK|nr:hypothetical protein [Caballeronia ptereochthonis]SAK39733.1 hypothetical protein AWB83_00113 [Caballeronia ptereochthonis]